MAVHSPSGVQHQPCGVMSHTEKVITRNILAAGQSHNTSEINNRRTTFIPHPQEESHRQSMYFVVIEEEGLKSC